MDTRFSNYKLRRAVPREGRAVFFFRRLIGFKRVRILQVQVYENVGKSLIQVFFFERDFN